MKINKKILTVFLFTSIVIPTISSCGKAKEEFIDNDFDGLVNSIDPDPNNNQYKVSLVNKNKEDKTFESSQLDLTIDYRYFIDHNYNNNLAKLGSFFVNETDSTKYVPIFKNNRYPKDEDPSLISPILTQIGCNDIMKLELNNSSKTDIYDNANILVGHHTFSLSNNDKYQIFFVLIKPYVNSSGWVSNLDVGATNSDGSLTNGYKEYAGDNHPDWKDKKNHKGFDVTSNRVLNKIKEYENSHINKEAHQITFITGHSRGGAITNLVAKMMIDEGFDVRAYAFNPPNNTQHDESITRDDKYNDIHNFVNKDDIVSFVPSSQWGFKIFGKNVYQIEIDKNLYSTFMKMNYTPNSNNAITKLDNLIVNLTNHDGIVSREYLYEFRAEDPGFEEAFVFEGMGHEQAAIDYYEGLKHYFEHSPEAKSSFEFYESMHDVDVSKIFFKTKPCLIMALVLDVAGKGEFSSILDYIDVSRRLIRELTNYFNELEFGEFSINGVKLAHEQPIACVMAEQNNPK